MDKVNFTTNEIPEAQDYNNQNINSENGMKNLIKAVSCDITGDVLFKNLFPTLGVVVAGSVTITATWGSTIGFAVKGVPFFIGASSSTNSFTPPPVGGSYVVEVRVCRAVNDVLENRYQLTADGVRTTQSFVVGKQESFYIQIEKATVINTDDYFVWKSCVITNTAGSVAKSSESDKTALLWHVL